MKIQMHFQYHFILDVIIGIQYVIQVLRKHDSPKKLQKLESTNNYGLLINQILTLFSKIFIQVMFCWIDVFFFFNMYVTKELFSCLLLII
jgi:hypothetical protein